MAAAVHVLHKWLFPGPAKAIPALDGPYAPNDALDGLDAVRVPEPDDICAGEGGAIVVASAKRLLRLAPEGAEPAVICEFAAPITALARLADGNFAVGVSNEGLYVLAAADGHALAQLGRVDDRALGDVTAIAGDAHGGLYLTVGSTRHPARDWVYDLMDARPSGQLLYWQPGAGDPEVLLDRLAYPNGIVIEPDGESLLFTQSWDHSLTRLRLVPRRAAAGRERVLANLPGYPARIAPAGSGGYWLALFARRTQLVELVLRENAFKHNMMEMLDPELWIRPALRSSGSHLEPLQGGGIKKLGIRKPWAPPRSYGLVVRLDAECEPVASLHSRVDGHYHGITAAREIAASLCIASKGHDAVLTTAAAP